MLVCRSRAKAVSTFQEGMHSIAVKGTSWDLQQPVLDAAAEIDAHINKLRVQKVGSSCYSIVIPALCRLPALAYEASYP